MFALPMAFKVDAFVAHPHVRHVDKLQVCTIRLTATYVVIPPSIFTVVPYVWLRTKLLLRM